MPQNVKVDLGDRSYIIHIGSGLLDDVGSICRELGLHHTCLVASDSNVDPLYGDRCGQVLKDAGMLVARAVVPAGESSKSQEKLFALYDAALENGMDRGALVVALGGGVVGDLAGYFAASYLRGIHCVQIPTSLLAMVDSSVGGKTGINLPQGKNLIGAFYQPMSVIADLDTLKTLPKREYISGLAEVVKYGVIRDAEFFAYLENNVDGLLSADPDVLTPVIARCCELKAEVVHLDEREGGLRAILNFGHTLGHALEQVSGYGTYLHGEAVAIGMVYAGRLSVEHLGFPQEECDRLIALLEKLKLPVKLGDYEWGALRNAISVDKKTAGSVPRFVLVEALGSVKTKCEVPDVTLEEVWNVSR